MANTTLTHQIVAREAAKLFEEASPFTMGINKGRQEEFGKDMGGYKEGDSVRIKIPSVNQVYDGATYAGGGAGDNNQETSVSLTLSGRKHVALQFSSKEKLLDITEYRERILRPQMNVLAAAVEADLMARAYQDTFNLVGTAGTIPSTMKTYAQARAKLQNFLAPSDDRRVMFTSDSNTELVDASRALFNPVSEIEKQYMKGVVGEAQNAKFFEHQSVPLHTNGNKVAGLTVNGAGQTGTTLSVAGTAAADTFTKGTVFTIAGVFAVHPLTGVAYSSLQQFTITADVTATGATTSLTISPAITPAAPNKTVSASPAAAAAITVVGAASTAYRQNLMFQKDAFTAAFAPLPVLASLEGYTARLPSGISVRVMDFADGKADNEFTRVDVLYGFATPRPWFASRITE